MNQKWNLQDIRPAEPKRKRPERPSNNEQSTTAETAASESGSRIPVTNGTKKSHRGILAVFALVIALVVGTIGVSIMMTGADVTIYPQHHTPTINSTITAYPEPRSDELSYEIMTIPATAEDQVEATGQEVVEERAEAVIEIIKSTPGSQELVATTRFESPEGLIFRTTESVLVPGATTDGDGSSPGTARVTVVADEPGVAYNLPANTRFTIPGFAEAGLTEQFESMYGQTTSDIRGGFAGPRYEIDDDELSKARQNLQMQLREQLLVQMETERPTDFILFTDAVTFTYEQLPSVEYEEDLVTIKEEATLRVPIFNRDEFASFIANAAIPSYEGAPVRIDNLDALSFSYSDAIGRSTNISNESALEFNLVGEPQIIWTYDEAELKEELAGEAKDKLRTIAAGSVAIEEAEAKIRPFWRQSYPDDVELITITEQLEGN